MVKVGGGNAHRTLGTCPPSQVKAEHSMQNWVDAACKQAISRDRECKLRKPQLLDSPTITGEQGLLLPLGRVR